MNFEFISALKKEAKDVIYATREYCEQHGLKYKELEGCMGIKICKSRSQQGLEGKSYFQLILKASH